MSALPARISEKFTKDPSGCWIWQACRDSSGYGHVRADGRPRPAHRVVYELLVGPIPRGLQLDHLCRNPSCVNPAHLEPVTQAENILRGQGACAQYARRSACGRGHLYTEATTHLSATHGRVCRTCTNEREREKRAAPLEERAEQLARDRARKKAQRERKAAS